MLFLGSFENLPCFTKRNLIPEFLKSRYALNDRIKRSLKNHKLLSIKQGFYMTSKFYFAEHDKVKLAEFISSKLCEPSYISLEYVMRKHGLLNSDLASSIITCITTKTSRSFKNFLGIFRYSNIKSSLFFGFQKVSFIQASAKDSVVCKYNIATKAKSLFDYLYLKPGLRGKIKYLKQQLFGNLGINWNNFSEQDFKEFDQYVWKSNSKKMMRIWHFVNEYFASKEFDRWAKELLRS